MSKPIDLMTLEELRDYARFLEKRLSAYEKPDYVYFLHDPDANVIKIGHSRNVPERLRVLSRQTGRSLELVGVLRGDKYTKRNIQQQFKPLLTNHSEWFRAEDTLLNYIKENTTQLLK